MLLSTTAPSVLKRRKSKAQGTGYWFRNQHEILLLGTKGEPPTPAMGTQAVSILYAPVGAHSAKPVEVLELIERYFPTLPKIELNARNARQGWDRWGSDAPADHASGGAGAPVPGDVGLLVALTNVDRAPRMNGEAR